MPRLKLSIVCCLALGLASGGVSAHRANYVLTELSWRVEQKKLEVVHSVHLDDAVVLLAMLGDQNADLDMATEEELLKYLQANFRLAMMGQPIALTSIGAQISGDNLWLYQEAMLSGFPQDLNVQSSFGFQLFANQTHQINLLVGTRVGTLMLDRQTTEGTF